MLEFLPRLMEFHALLWFLFLLFAKAENLEEINCLIGECVGFRIAALIPARAGSKGIIDKNLARVGNESLVGKTIKTVRKCNGFDSIWVTTDGEKIADEAIKNGAEVHWRDPSTATDNATTISAAVDFLKSHLAYDAIAVIQCTSPFLQQEFLRSALEKLTSEKRDCVFSASRSHNLRWKEDRDGSVFSVNFDPKFRPRRQDWAGELVENGMFYLAKRNLIVNEGVLQNDKCGVIEIPKKYSLEIDDEFDLKLANAMLPYIL